MFLSWAVLETAADAEGVSGFRNDTLCDMELGFLGYRRCFLLLNIPARYLFHLIELDRLLRL